MSHPETFLTCQKFAAFRASFERFPIKPLGFWSKLMDYLVTGINQPTSTAHQTLKKHGFVWNLGIRDTRIWKVDCQILVLGAVQVLPDTLYTLGLLGGRSKIITYFILLGNGNSIWLWKEPAFGGIVEDATHYYPLSQSVCWLVCQILKIQHPDHVWPPLPPC